MKKCDQFKELILTDYLDGELEGGDLLSVEKHLAQCSDCRALLKEVRNNAAMPFQATLRQPVPEGLWDAIKENIEARDQYKSPLADFAGQLKGWLTFPRLVPVFASLMVMLVAGTVSLNTMQGQAKDKDQGEYLASLVGPSGSSSDNNDLGTPIEHYFL